MLSLLLITIAVVGSLLPTVTSAIVKTPLSSFTSGTEGVKFIGAESSQTGTSIAMIGDYNKDGTNDFMIAAPFISITVAGTARVKCGLAVIVLGQSGNWTEVDMSTVTSGSTMRRVIGGAGSDNLGTAAGTAGDVNDDGYDDVLIGARWASYPGRDYSGTVFVIFGMDSTTPYTDIDLAGFAASATVGFAIFGPTQNAFLGYGPLSIRAFGDLNGDSIDDFAVVASSATYATRAEAGIVWFIYGKSSAPSHIDLASLGSAGIQLGGAKREDLFGYVLDNVGDFNGDGKDDVVIGAYQHDPLGRLDAGIVYLIFDKTSLTNMDMATFVTGAKGVRFLGGNNDDRVGWSVSGAGDINGDGKMDLLIGADGVDASSRPSSGQVYAIFGTSTPFTADVELGSLVVGTQGFTISGAIQYQALGASVSRAGDLDQDGIDDFLVGGNGDIGWVYVLYGSLTAPTANIDLLTYNGRVVAFTDVKYAGLGSVVRGGSDVTGDSIPDILFGASQSSVTPAGGGNSRDTAGKALMIKGPISPPPGGPTVVPSEAPTRAPTLAPTVGPTVSPTVTPTLTPSTQPSQLPTTMPTTEPSLAPTVYPTIIPTTVPSVVPTVLQTMAPTKTPTARPTLEADRSNEIVLGVEQELNNVNKTAYDAQKAAWNRTIQHTVAEMIDGVTPDRVTEIVVEEEEEEEGRVAHLRALAVGSSRVLLKYKVTVYDPVLSAEVLTAQLKAKVQSGDMGNAFLRFAAMFNIANLDSLTFGEPQVTNLNPPENQKFKDPPNDGEIAGIVIGGFLFLMLLTGGVWLLTRHLAVSGKAAEESRSDLHGADRSEVQF